MYSLSFGYREKWVIGVATSFSFALFFLGALITPIAFATGGDSGTSYTPTCPFEPTEGRIIVALNKKLFSDQESTAIQGPVNLWPLLGAGTYDVSLASYDVEHSDEPMEENESWFLTLESALGSSVATTSAIDDLPDQDKSISQKVNENLTLTEDVRKIFVQHTAYPTDLPNSITAVCVAFDRNVNQEPPTTGPVCGNKALEGGEMCDDGNTTPGDGCSAICTLETLICEDTGEKSGWYGEYFNYSSDHPAMELPAEEWGANYGDPLSATSTWTADWYDEQYFRFSRIDPTLSFGSAFFPFDVAAEELDNDENRRSHDYHFGVHWRARVGGVPGEYSYTLISDDDAWVYVDGILIDTIPGVHPPQTIEGNLSLTGVNVIDVYFAERHTVLSYLDFSIDGDLEIAPLGPSCEIPGTISGVKYFDRNANGAHDQDEEEIPGWGVTLTRGGVEYATTTTDANGTYSFTDLSPGFYAVSEEKREGWTETSTGTTSPYSFSVLGNGVVFSNGDFGNVASTSVIHGTKYEDIDGDGVWDEEEPGLPGWEIKLSRAGVLFATTTTAIDGTYAFNNLAPITYVVTEEVREGWLRTQPAEEGYTVSLIPNEEREYIDFGNHKIATTTLIISNEGEENITETSVTLTWATNIPASSVVVYATTSVPTFGTAPLYGYGTTSPIDSTFVTSHAIGLSGLTPNTTYYWRGVSTSSSTPPLEAVGGEQSFVTQSHNDGGNGDNGGGDGNDGGNGDNGGGSGGVGGTETGSGGSGGGGGGTIFQNSSLAYGFTQGATGGTPILGVGVPLFVLDPGSGTSLPPSPDADGVLPDNEGVPSGTSLLTDDDTSGSVEEDEVGTTTTNEITQAAGLIFFGLDIRIWALILLAIAIILFIIWYSRKDEEEENQPKIPFHT
mgnify:CR=1 FL=1